MRVVVTGASGHVGTNLTRSLIQQGHRVDAFDQAPSPHLDPAVRFAQGDVRDEAALQRCFEGAERVFHLAALISIDGDRGGLVYEVNVDGARAAARAALRAGVARFVHFSSIHAFDSSTGGTVHEDSPRALGDGFAAYDRSKAQGEAAVREVIGDGLDAVILHPTGVIGPTDHAPSRAGRALRDAARGRLPVAFDGGFDFVDVRDVVSGATAAGERGERGRNYILSGGHYEMSQLAGLAADANGAPGPLVFLPRSLLRRIAPLPTLVSRLCGKEARFTTESLDTLGTRARFSHERATRELGHAPRPIAQTISELVGAFIDAGTIAPSRARGLADTHPAMVRHLDEHPLHGDGERRILGQLLLEVALADGSLDSEERELITQFAQVESPHEADGPPTAEALRSLPSGVRESLLLAALALAWVDEDYSIFERDAIRRWERQLGILRARGLELEGWAKEYVVDQLLDAIYADGTMDAEERKRADEAASRLDLSPSELHRLDERVRRRRGIRE